MGLIAIVVACSGATPTTAPTSEKPTFVSPTSPATQPTATPLQTATAATDDSLLQVMTAPEFASSVRAAGLDQRTVIVQGRIVSGALAPADCAPSYGAQPCEIGVLDGVQPPLSVAGSWSATPKAQSSATFTDNPRIDWPYWWMPSAPVDGPLLLHVFQGTVQYVGRPRANTAGLTWPVDAAKAIDPGSLAPGELVLVDGWLTGVGGELDCVKLRTELNAALADRSCSNAGWLFDRPDASVAAASDRAAGIEVQDQAYGQFAPGPDTRYDAPQPDARKAIYALAPRLEGWCAEDASPCWRWTISERVAADFSLVPTRLIDCGRVSILMPEPSPSTRPKGDVTIQDETGVVQSCIASYAPSGIPGVLVENPLPGGQTVDVSWTGSSCDATTAFSFRNTETGYELVGQTMVEPCPDETVTRHSLMISMGQSVPAESVRVSINGTPGAEPTPTPSTPVSVIPCSTSARHATIVDATGWVDACETVPGTEVVDSIAIAESVAHARVALRVIWTGSECDGAPVFWLASSGVRITLDGELANAACGPTDVPYEVLLTLNTDMAIPATDVTLTRPSQPRPIPLVPVPAASAEVETAAGGFTITAQAGKATYASGEPIDISGTLTWNGPAGSTVDIFGDESDVTDALVHFGWEKLDDDLRVNTRFTRNCHSAALEAGVPMTASFAKETANSGDTQHDAFWHSYFSTPVLTLPPGRYRVMARAEFSIGECSRDNRVVVYVPIFIFVTD